jgi:hypothetical protein
MTCRNHSSRHRKFTASDGKEYSWSWRTNTRENLEWSVSTSETYLDGKTLNLRETVCQHERTTGRMVCVEDTRRALYELFRLHARCGGAIPPSGSRQVPR